MLSLPALRLAPCGSEKLEVRVSDLKHSSSRKKPYHRPMCTLKSMSEVGALFRKSTVDHEIRTGPAAASAPADLPVLLVEGYGGDLPFIRRTIRTPARQLEPFSILKNEGLVEMQFAEGQDTAPRETFLLLDLRHRRHGERGLLESIGGNQNFSEDLPHVILVTSLEQFHGWRGIDPQRCWRLQGHPSSADLTAALRLFLRLCATLANWPPEEGSSPGRSGDHALIAKTKME